MANTRQSAIAAGFIHALRDPHVLAAWQRSKGSERELSELIQKTLGLSEPPSPGDMQAMKSYAESHLVEEHKALAASQADAPHVVGMTFEAQTTQS